MMLLIFYTHSLAIQEEFEGRAEEVAEAEPVVVLGVDTLMVAHDTLRHI